MTSGSGLKRNLLWAFAERVSSKFVLFALQLVLARILVPEDYGLLAILLVFVNLGTILVNSGLSSALIQKKEIDETDASSVFYVSLAVTVFIYGVIFFSAPYIADFYDDGRICLMLRIISLVLFVGVYNSVQRAILSRSLGFKQIFKANLWGAVLSALISVIMALEGCGVWSIIVQYISYQLIITVASIPFIKWYPKWLFNFGRVGKLWNFGWKYMLTSIVSMMSTEIYVAIIGRVYTKSQLGEYDTGDRIPQTISDTFSSSMTTVLFPTFAKLQNEPAAIRDQVKKLNRLATFLMFPLMFGMAACAYPLILIVLEEKWLGAVPYFQLACLMFAFYPLHVANMQAISSMGRSDITLKNELIKKSIELLSLGIFIWFGLVYVAIGRVAASYIALFINMYPNKKMLGYPIMEQCRDFSMNLVVTLISAALTWGVGEFLALNVYLLLILQLVIMTASYILLSYCFNRSNISVFSKQIKTIIRK